MRNDHSVTPGVTRCQGNYMYIRRRSRVGSLDDDDADGDDRRRSTVARDSSVVDLGPSRSRSPRHVDYDRSDDDSDCPRPRSSGRACPRRRGSDADRTRLARLKTSPGWSPTPESGPWSPLPTDLPVTTAQQTLDCSGVALKDVFIYLFIYVY